MVSFVRAGATELQFSAHRGALVSIAAHIVRMHQNWAKAIHRCDYTIFVGTCVKNGILTKSTL